jgi:EmrB/QacA subfamily drug resistance transporter
MSKSSGSPQTEPINLSGDRVRWRAYGVAVGVASLTILDLAKINVAIPAISTVLGAGATEVQLLLSGFVLAFGLLLVPAGRIGDLYSRRFMFLLGLSLFTLASVGGTLAPTIELLIFSRIMQGFAAGILMPQVLGLVQQLFQGRERGQAFGIFGAVIGLSTAFGPTIGGFLVGVGGDDFGWRLLFAMNVPLGIAAFVMAFRLLPRTQDTSQAVKDFDIVGTFLLALTTFSLMLPFVLTTGTDSDDPTRWWWLVGAVVSGAVFILWERAYLARGKVAIIDFELFKISTFRNGILISSFYFAALPATFIVLTLFLQRGLGFSPIVAGMVTIPFALISAYTSYRSGKVVHKRGRPLVVVGLLGVLLGFGLVVLASVLVPDAYMPWAVAVAMTVAGAGGGAVISPNQTLMLEDIPVVQGGLAGSLAQVGQRIGTAIGLAAALSVFFFVVADEVNETLSVAYHDAFVVALTVIVAMVVAALIFALLDARVRDKEPQAAAPEKQGREQ